MKNNKRDKVILITGGSSGIGKSIGIYLSSKGYRVYGTSRSPEKYSDFNEFRLLALDVSDKNSIETAIDTVIAEEGRIDVLINNAGAGITGPLEEIPEEEIVKNFTTNFFGPVNVIKAVLPSMRKQKNGLIINVTSIAGYMGLPFRGIYSASKAALEVTTEAWRMELKPFNIKMTNVAPGDFATNIAAGRYHAPLNEDSPYKTSYSKTLQLMDTHVDSGQDPKLMAMAVEEIIENDAPKVRYKVAVFMQRFSVVLHNFLPSKLYEKLLMNHYKL
ncbi:SDR family oxidoreductase [Aquimarina sp. W85]|uniref:SDR family oxidoreductase n=1 Tax=Aquimarina rhodophyticola TaxID=3342246 RepID=UPI0036722059